MPVTNPWLAGAATTTKLNRARLEERILNLLSSLNTCVLATAGPDGPLATPMRYYHLDFTILLPASPASPKMRNLSVDPRVCIGIVAPLVSQASSRGAQIFGEARSVSPGESDHDHYWAAYRWESEHVERSRSLDEPRRDPLIVVEAQRIVYTEHWLRREGYAPRQYWRAKA